MLGSWMGEVFAIGFVFNVYVKFKAWNSTGMGDRITLPIRVFNNPKLDHADEPYRVPEVWTPITDNFDPTYLYHEQFKVSDYYQRVWLVNWRNWYQKLDLQAPSQISQEYEVAGAQSKPRLSEKDLSSVGAVDQY